MSIALMIDPQGDPEIISARTRRCAPRWTDWIPKILAAQEPDGYLQTAFTLDRVGGAKGPVAQQQVRALGSRPSRRPRRLHRRLLPRVGHQSLHDDGQEGRPPLQRREETGRLLVEQSRAGAQESWYDGHQEMEQALVRFGRFVNDMEGGGKGDAYIRTGEVPARLALHRRGQPRAGPQRIRPEPSAGDPAVRSRRPRRARHLHLLRAWRTSRSKRTTPITRAPSDRSGTTSSTRSTTSPAASAAARRPRASAPNYSLRQRRLLRVLLQLRRDLLPVEDESRLPRRAVRRPLRRDDVQRAARVARTWTARISTTRIRSMPAWRGARGTSAPAASATSRARC